MRRRQDALRRWGGLGLVYLLAFFVTYTIGDRGWTRTGDVYWWLPLVGTHLAVGVFYLGWAPPELDNHP